MQLGGTLRARLFLPAVLALFAASGFAGLIYEFIWCRKVYRRSAERFLEREQIDDVDESNIPGYQP